MTKVERTCPRCGLVFHTGRLDGLCPSCLLGNTLDSDEGGEEHAFWEEAQPAPSLGRSFSHFEIIEELGRGGMGTVYRARDHGTGRMVALKILQAHHLDAPDLVKRFRSEVRAVTSLDHRHILPVHEVGEHDGIPFFSMKLATGGSLAQHLSEFLGHHRKSAQLVAKIARGIQHAHEHGILHRDLKPGNILLDDAGEPYVCDFGLAKWIDDDRRLTITSAVLGTPHYIAPEQASGKAGLTIAADVYSLGAILYELITGRPPFIGDTVIETLRQATECSPAKPSSIVTHTPRDLEIICLKALEREPSARYKTANALAEDLENWLTGRPIRARPVSAAEQLWRWARRNPLPATLGATLAIAITTLAVGATIAAINIDRARNLAVAAEKESREQLYNALLAQAKASRMTGQAGHRIDAIAAIKKAAEIHPSLELRNEAIAALSLIDLKAINTLKVRENFSQRIAFDATQGVAAVADRPGEIRLLDLRSGFVLKTIPTDGQQILSLVHGGSKYLAARSADDAVQVFECSTGRKVGHFSGHRIPRQIVSATDCIFSPDETRIALGSPDGLEIIELSTGREIARLKTTQPEQCTFSPDGKTLAFANPKEKAIYIWPFSTGVDVYKIDSQAEPTSLSWSHDDRLLAAGCADYSIHLFDTKDWRPRGTLGGHRQAVTNLAFSHKGDMLVSSSSDNTIRLWDLRTLTQLVEMTCYWSGTAIGFSADDQFLGITSSRTAVALVQVVGLERICTAFAAPSAKEQLWSSGILDYSPDSKLIAKASTTSVQIFDAKSHVLLATQPIPVPTQTTLRFIEDGKTLAILSRRTGLTLHSLKYADGKLSVLSTQTAGRWHSYVLGSSPMNLTTKLCLTSDKENRGLIWDMQKDEPFWSLEDTPTIKDMALSPDEKWVAVASRDRFAQIWSVTTRKKVVELPTGKNGVVTFSPSGRWLGCAGSGENIVLWNVGSWERGPSLPAEVDEKTAYFAFSPDESYFAAGMRDKTALVSLPGGELLGILEQHYQPETYTHLRFSPNGTQLASQGMDNSLVLWDLKKLRHELGQLGLDWKSKRQDGLSVSQQ